jgi:hypothetical protein
MFKKDRMLVMNSKEWPPHLFRGPQSTAHPYPLEIGMRAQVFIVGAIFYSAFVDEAMGQYLHQTENPYIKIRDQFLVYGVSKQAWDDNWKAFEVYINAFSNPTIQNALFGMVMHWDWYIEKLGVFVEFARPHVNSPSLDKKQEVSLRRIGFQNISNQLAILSSATGLKFDGDSTIVPNLVEMDLVRNLGMHNQWAVNQFYRERALDPTWQMGMVRTVTIKDLEVWQQALTSTIFNTSDMIAKKYAGVPDYTSS